MIIPGRIERKGLLLACSRLSVEILRNVTNELKTYDLQTTYFFGTRRTGLTLRFPDVSSGVSLHFFFNCLNKQTTN